MRMQVMRKFTTRVTAKASREATEEKIILFGFSDGAFTGVKYAGMYPQTIRKFIAVGATELYPACENFSS